MRGDRHVLVFHRSSVQAAEAYSEVWRMGRIAAFDQSSRVKEFLDQLDSRMIESRGWGMIFSDVPRRPNYALIQVPGLHAAERVASLASAHGLNAYISDELPEEDYL